MEAGLHSPVELEQRKILVVGCGSIGMRHIGNLRALGQREVLACSSPTQVAKAVRRFGVVPFTTLQGALEECPDVVLVCNATNLHLVTAAAAVEAGAHVFIEKPISHTLEGVSELIDQADHNSLTLAVGYCMRFHPVLRVVQSLLRRDLIGHPLTVRAEMGQSLPTWRQDRDYRQTYSAQRALGGGIILDMSHELDYLLWLFGPVRRIVCFAEHLSSLDVDAEDTALMLLEFELGLLGEVHLDFVQPGYVRTGNVVGDAGVVRWWFKEPRVEHRTAGRDEWTVIEFPDYDPNQMYVDEIVQFLSCLQCNLRPAVTATDAAATLKLALAALQSSESGEVMAL